MPHDTFENPLSSRYASPGMLGLFSDDFKFTTWRKLWVALAEAESDLGLKISKAQIAEMKRNISDIDYKVVAKREKEVRHDVMAHLYAFGKKCPKAKPVMHLGATSCYVTDNTELIQIREALQLVEGRLLKTVKSLSAFAKAHRALPCLGYTHLQTAQPTTVGKRAALWLQDLVSDFRTLEFVLSEMKFLGVKGTTGTQASFLKLFGGNHSKVKALDKAVAQKMGFSKIYPVTGQTYPRKYDHLVASVLSGVAQSAAKFATDIRLLQAWGEMEEPFGKKQIGSSAMPYKRNPMRSERINALSRFAIILAQNPAHTASVQGFERTLDDSANRRLVLSQLFLAIDAILLIYDNIASGLVVHKKKIQKRLSADLMFVATENILMLAVERGGDRQNLHERIRFHSLAAKRAGEEDKLLEDIAMDPAFSVNRKDIEKLLDAKTFIGRAPKQVDEFLRSDVAPLLKKHGRLIPKDRSRLKV